tara:strand:- start:35 stop:229 length:195 start_codon:yes stop_codon:yes gene_type:complete
MDAQQEAETRRVVRTALLDAEESTTDLFKLLRARAIIELYLYAFEVEGVANRLNRTALDDLKEL